MVQSAKRKRTSLDDTDFQPGETPPGVPYTVSPSKARRTVARINGETTPRRAARLAQRSPCMDPRAQPSQVSKARTPASKRRKSDPATPRLPPVPEDNVSFSLRTPTKPKEVRMGENGEDGESLASNMSVVSESTVKGKGREMSVDEETVRGEARDNEGGTELYRPPPGRAYVGRPPPGLQATVQARQVLQRDEDSTVAGSSRDVYVRERSSTPAPTGQRMYIGSNVPLKIHDVLARVRDRDGDEDMREATPTPGPAVESSDMDGESFHSVDARSEISYVMVPRSLVQQHMAWFLAKNH